VVDSSGYKPDLISTAFLHPGSNVAEMGLDRVRALDYKNRRGRKSAAAVLEE
jgi:aryl carrier-like protein